MATETRKSPSRAAPEVILCEAPLSQEQTEQPTLYALYCSERKQFVYQIWDEEQGDEVMLLLFSRREVAENHELDLADGVVFESIEVYPLELWEAMKIVEDVPLTPQLKSPVVGIVIFEEDGNWDETAIVHWYMEGAWYLTDSVGKLKYVPFG